MSVAKKPKEVFCIFCKKSVAVSEYDEHEKSEQHQIIIKAKLTDISEGAMMCKSCMVPVNSEVIWNSHSNGKNHKKQVNFLRTVGKTGIYDRPFSLGVLDKDSTDPIGDSMFTVVPDLFAPLIEESDKADLDLKVIKENTAAAFKAKISKPSEVSKSDASAESAANPTVEKSKTELGTPTPAGKTAVETSASTTVPDNQDFSAKLPSSAKENTSKDVSTTKKAEEPSSTDRAKSAESSKIYADPSHDPKINNAADKNKARVAVTRTKLDGKVKGKSAQQLKDDEELRWIALNADRKGTDRRRQDDDRTRHDEVPRKMRSRGRRSRNYEEERSRRGDERFRREDYEEERSRHDDERFRREDDRCLKGDRSLHASERISRERSGDPRPLLQEDKVALSKERKVKKSRWDIDDQECNEGVKRMVNKYWQEGDAKNRLRESGGPKMQANFGQAPKSLGRPLTTSKPHPLNPPPGAINAPIFPSIDPYASMPPAFNPAMGIPPMTNMRMPPMFPPVPPPMGMPPMPYRPPMSMPHMIPGSHDHPIDMAEKCRIDMTPRPNIDIHDELEAEEVSIFIPDFFVERYPEHPHKGVVKADADQAYAEFIEAERKAKEPLRPLPISIHSKMYTKPIGLHGNDEVKFIDIDNYPSLRGQVKPIIKPNQKFVFIGSNCTKVIGPNHFLCQLCNQHFNDTTKTAHLLDKCHLLNILWNWDPDSAQIIKDIEVLNKPLFDKKVMEAAKEIQKKEIKLLSETQLRVRARILDENVQEQNKYFVKNDVFDPRDFPTHDFSYLNPEPLEESSESEDEEPNKSNKIKILEAGITNMLKSGSGDGADVVSDNDTAIAALNICRKLSMKLEKHFKQYTNPPGDETTDKLKKVKHFFNNLLIIQQILDVYPSAVKESAANVVKEHQQSSSAVSLADQIPSEPAAMRYMQDQMVPDAAAQYNYHHEVAQQPEYDVYQEFYSQLNSGYDQHSYPAAVAQYAGQTAQEAPKVAPIDPRSSKKAEGYSLYSDSVDEGGIEWYRQNRQA